MGGVSLQEYQSLQREHKAASHFIVYLPGEITGLFPFIDIRFDFAFHLAPDGFANAIRFKKSLALSCFLSLVPSKLFPFLH